MIKPRSTKAHLQIPLLLLWGLVLFGCTNEREGEFVTHWLACQKSEVGKWVSADRSLFNRFDIIHESRYQVSFASQRVVSSTGFELKNCTVYDRNNWDCKDIDGSLFVVKDGQGPLLNCGKATGLCFLRANFLNRASILLRGGEEADRLCSVFSEGFEMHLKSKS
jgi:hypothetical protein